MRVAITGATGLIGSNLASNLQKESLFLTSQSGGTSDAGVVKAMDLTNFEKTLSWLDETKPNLVFHTAAISSVDLAELHKTQAEKLNVDCTKTIGKWCSKNNARLIYFSSDFVFDGISLDYNEKDMPKPLSWYGETKWKSENELQSILEDLVIIRPILVYGSDKMLSRQNFVTMVIDRLSNGTQMNITSDQFRMPTYVEDLADAAIKIAYGAYKGIIHISGDEKIGVFDFALAVTDVFDLDPCLLKPVTTSSMNQIGQRPLKSGFDLTLVKSLINYEPHSVREGLTALRNNTMM
ncbi:MAG: SDR family oxidoreductase [Salibacteraceae bacterium]